MKFARWFGKDQDEAERAWSYASQTAVAPAWPSRSPCSSRTGKSLGRPWAMAAAARCRAQLASLGGDPVLSHPQAPQLSRDRVVRIRPR
jgi:hypothetical protein